MQISEKITAHPQERQAHCHTDHAELRLRLASEGQEATLAALGVPRKWCAVRLIYQDGTLRYVAHYNTGLWVWGHRTHTSSLLRGSKRSSLCHPTQGTKVTDVSCSSAP